MMAMPDDMIGAIKIKDGLFIGDEFAAQVSSPQILCFPIQELIKLKIMAIKRMNT
jgi:hypothetical protein